MQIRKLDPEQIFQSRQLEAMKTVWQHKYTLYGGAAGGGKSYFLRWLALFLLVYWGQRGIAGVRVGLFCEDYPSLRERHISKIPFEFPEQIGTLNRSDNEFRLHKEYGSGVIAFRNLDDPAKYLSAEFAAILIDELTRNKREIFDFLNMRMRWAGIGDTKFVGATNPGSIGHLWVKKLWIDKDFSGEAYDQSDFAFVQALYSDNSYLDQGYEKQLASLPEKLREAYMMGNWDVFEGQFFPEFDRNVHVCDPFPIPEQWQHFTATDYGTTNPFCTLWGAVDFEGNLWIYREAYEKGLNATEQAMRIAAAERDGEPIRARLADPSMWAKTQTVNAGRTYTLRSVADYYHDEGLRLTPANNDIMNGCNAIREYLKITDNTAKLRVFSTCKNLIRTLPAMVYDEKKPEIYDSKGEDHAVDTLRYLIMHVREPVKTIEEVKPIRKPDFINLPEFAKGDDYDRTDIREFWD